MKKYLMILLVFVSLSLILLNNYLKEQTPIYQEKVNSLNSEINGTMDIVAFNKWLKVVVLPTIDNLSTQQEAEDSLVKIQETLDKSIGSTLIDFNKDVSGKIVMSLSSVIYKNDIYKLMNLFNLKLEDGIMNLKSLKVDKNKITTEFELIKFYREMK